MGSIANSTEALNFHSCSLILFDRCLNFARIFTEMSESFTEAIVQFPNRVSEYEPLKILIRCRRNLQFNFFSFSVVDIDEL